MPEKQEKILYTVEEVAEELRVCQHTVRKWVREELLPASFIGIRYYVTVYDLLDFVASRKGSRCNAGNPAFKAKGE